MNCTDCCTPLTPTTVRVAFQGRPRKLYLRLTGIPALACRRCRIPVLEASVREHLRELGAPLGSGWTLTVRLEDREAA